MELQDRERHILDALIKEYVRTAEPVSSEDLILRHRLPWSSATIRNDLVALDKAGYVRQPHVSAGRVPTDKAYRFYINEHEEKKPRKERRSLTSLSHNDGSTDEEFLRNAASILSRLSHGFTTAGLLDDRLFFKYGFSEVLQEPEFSDTAAVQGFAECIDEVERSVDELFRTIPAGHPRAFVGHENPIKEAKEYGMIVYAYEKDGRTGKKKQIVSILGPKRMDYERNLSLMREFDEIVRDLYT